MSHPVKLPQCSLHLVVEMVDVVDGSFFCLILRIHLDLP